jgi:hypothetical protein
LKTFARRLKEYLPGILAHCHWPLHTSLLEVSWFSVKWKLRLAG